MEHIILASGSPRRREICAGLGIPVEVIPAAGEAPMDPDRPLEDAVLAVARGKAEEVAAAHPSRVVLGADTVVVADGAVLGKPKDPADATRMLRALGGKTHCVLTAVWVTDGEQGDGFVAEAKVTFCPLCEADIAEYVQTGEPLDKAGAYGIQGLGARYIDRLDGDFFTVMGLPSATWRFLRDRFSKKLRF